MDKHQHPLLQSFQEFFTLSMAASTEQKRDAYRIRYRVYCEDMQYEPAQQFPDGLETDEFDRHSLHCLVTHKRTARPAGCLRLVEADSDLLRRSGFLMEQAGDTTEYHGRRALYFTTAERVVNNLRPELREFYNAIHRDFSAQVTQAENVA